MHAVRVRVFRICMAIGAHDLPGRSLVRKRLHVLVAIHTGKLHRSVNGIVNFLCIDEEGDLLTVYIFGEGGVAVTREAIFVFQLVLGASGEGRAQQKHRQRTEQDPAGNFHDYEETLDELGSP